MILISINGGTKTQRNLTDDATRYILGKLLPRTRVLDIDIIIKNLLREDLAGYCLHKDKGEFELGLHNRGHLYNYISYLAHELIHLKQYNKKELMIKGKLDVWHGEEMPELSYAKQPWEIEAWELQSMLAKDFLKNSLGVTYKAAKELSPRTMKQIDWDYEYKTILDTIAAQERDDG